MLSQAGQRGLAITPHLSPAPSEHGDSDDHRHESAPTEPAERKETPATPVAIPSWALNSFQEDQGGPLDTSETETAGETTAQDTEGDTAGDTGGDTADDAMGDTTEDDGDGEPQANEATTPGNARSPLPPVPEVLDVPLTDDTLTENEGPDVGADAEAEEENNASTEPTESAVSPDARDHSDHEEPLTASPPPPEDGNDEDELARAQTRTLMREDTTVNGGDNTDKSHEPEDQTDDVDTDAQLAANDMARASEWMAEAARLRRNEPELDSVTYSDDAAGANTDAADAARASEWMHEAKRLQVCERFSHMAMRFSFVAIEFSPYGVVSCSEIHVPL